MSDDRELFRLLSKVLLQTHIPVKFNADFVELVSFFSKTVVNLEICRIYGYSQLVKISVLEHTTFCLLKGLIQFYGKIYTRKFYFHWN